MKSLAFFLTTLGAFVAIYFWVYLDRKDRPETTTGTLIERLKKFIRRRVEAANSSDAAKTADSGVEAAAGFNFQSDLESEKVTDAKVPETDPAWSSVDEPAGLEVSVERATNRKRNLEKLKSLVDKAKAIPTAPPNRKRVSRSQARLEGKDSVAPEWRLRTKITNIERVIRARRGVSFLESIPEALLSRDSFTN